jgi:predicted RecA/RadA family phage recombinase
MSTYSQPGVVLPITLGGTTAKGALVAVGNAYAVTLEAGGDGDVVQAAFEGVFPLPKVAPLVINQGETLYLNSGNLTNVANSNPVGIAAYGAASAATSVMCKLTDAKSIFAAAKAYADSL